VKWGLKPKKWSCSCFSHEQLHFWVKFQSLVGVRFIFVRLKGRLLFASAPTGITAAPAI
jgi:hypothetical protein